MNDPATTLSIQRKIPKFFWGFFCVALLLLLVALLIPSGAAGIVSVGAMLAALSCWPWQAGSRGYRLTDEGLLNDTTNDLLTWDSLNRVTYSGHCVSPSVNAIGNHGRVVATFGKKEIALANHKDLTGAQLYSHLWNIVLSHREVELSNPTLREHFEKQVSRFGADQVIASGQGSLFTVNRIPVQPRLLPSFLILSISGFTAGGLYPDEPIGWIVGGVSLFVLVIVLVGWLSEKSNRKSFGNCEVVIDPEGFAMFSKKLRGVMKWEEVKSIKLMPSFRKPTYLKITVAGADILLADDYQHPAWYLLDRAETYRRSGREKVSVGVQSKPPIETGNPYQPPGSE